MSTHILILSDTHGRGDLVQEALRRCKPDLLLFCGDGLRDLAYIDIPCPLYAVRGNCDFMMPALDCIGGEPQDEILIPLDGINILLMHGHTYHVKSGLAHAAQRAIHVGANALVFGHTHIPLDTAVPPAQGVDGLHLFNPGSLREYPHSFGTLTLHKGIPLFNHGQLEK